jgi:hypothetical protein
LLTKGAIALLLSLRERFLYNAEKEAPMSRPPLFFGLMVYLLFSFPLAAEKLEEGWSFTQTISASVNPLGLDFGTAVSYTYPLFPEKTGVLWDTARVEGGLKNSLTPSYEAVSAFLHIEPAAFFQLSMTAEVRCLYDALGFGLTPLAGYSSSYSASTRKDSDRKNGAGLRYTISPILRGSYGNFLFGNTLSLILSDMRTMETDGLDYYYEPASDIVLKTFDGYILNDTALLYRFTSELLGGIGHTILFVPASDYVSERMTLMGYGKKLLGRVWRGSLAVLCGAHLRDRYNGLRDGKIYLAAQLGLSRRL